MPNDSLSHNVLIRPYEPRDRSAVWKICCDTADEGKPVENIFRDREVVADFLVRYYTDYEPGAMWVAEEEGRVVGYVSGCLDNRRYRRIMARRLGPLAVLKAIGRGLLGSRRTWRFLGRGMKNWLQGKWPAPVPEKVYSGHLHVNIQQEFRGHEVGRRLVEKFCEQARAAGLKGVYASVNANNRAACQFFERLRFILLSASPATETDRNRHTPERVIYGTRF